MVQNTSTREGAPLKEGGITFEEFLIQYDGQHAEWFPDGTVLVHMANNEAHILLFKFLIKLLDLYLEFNPIGRLFTAAFTMKVSGDLPKREPDLLIVLNEHADRIKRSYLDGAADIAIEIVSPESVERDYGVKFAEYEAAGVQEYWLFDPERKVARIHELTISDDTRVYTERPLDAQGRLTSGILPGFAFDAHLLWKTELPGIMALIPMVSAMIGISTPRTNQDDSA